MRTISAAAAGRRSPSSPQTNRSTLISALSASSPLLAHHQISVIYHKVPVACFTIRAAAAVVAPLGKGRDSLVDPPPLSIISSGYCCSLRDSSADPSTVLYAAASSTTAASATATAAATGTAAASQGSDPGGLDMYDLLWGE
ncbi:hypothetical protein L1987_06986 [Smallanthus sonchifolius]|uniref:Uncharacterized protein n=1 Tax=Smallanthus sonchifolius TaxID=185202 RepID=A0ACB9JZK8_9ASTR|nr:hypothetical protein L1987_06986 [Smallanthus sonchifolius]